MAFPKLTITYPDESQKVVDIKPSARVAWERHFAVPFMSMMIPARVAADKGEYPDGALLQEHVLYLGYVSLDPKADPAGFDDWLDTVAQITFGDETESDEGAEAEESAGPLDSIPSPS